MKPLLVTSGEPAGVGLDVCLALANCNLPVVILADKSALAERATMLGVSVTLHDYTGEEIVSPNPGQLMIYPLSCPERVVPGHLNIHNAAYVMNMLTIAVQSCLNGEFSGLITAPVHKAILNDAGFHFTGHTEFFREQCQVSDVVMMLASPLMKVALATTHIPLCKVSQAITTEHLLKIIRILYASLRLDFSVAKPKICVAGLNPHAGESGYLGREEIETITPALTQLNLEGITVKGPFPADTLFSQENCTNCDVFLTMYHDQGLPVLKYADFEHAVNVTLGLPIIRTSVDHGTALELAGSAKANPSSLIAAVNMAYLMSKQREQ